MTAKASAPSSRRRSCAAAIALCIFGLAAVPFGFWGLDNYCRVSLAFVSSYCSSLTVNALLGLLAIGAAAVPISLLALIGLLLWPRRG